MINSATFGGAHNQLLAAVPVLRERGLRPVALLPAEPGSAPDRLRGGGVSVTQLPLLRPRAESGPRALAVLARRYPGQIKQIAEFLDNERAAFVQLHGLLTLDAAWAARRVGVPIVWQLIDTRPPWPLRRLLTPLVRSMATLTMSAGATVAGHYRGLGDSETHFCFLPPVNHSEAALGRARDQREAARGRLGVSGENRLIGALGNFNRQKGFEVLLDVVPQLMMDPAVRVRIRGAAQDADYRAELDVQIATLPSEIVNIGELELDLHALDFIAALDLLVVPSVGRSEGIPTVALEAIALGTPVVASDVGGIREILADGETGWLFAAGSSVELRGAIDRSNEPGIRSAVPRAALIHLHHVEARMGFDAVHRDAYGRLAATPAAS